jgi:hypothetical protein
MADEIKTKPESFAPHVPATAHVPFKAHAAKAKPGDHVKYYEAVKGQDEPRAWDAIVVSLGPNDVAALKVPRPIVRGVGGGIAKLTAPFSSEKKAGSWGLA